MTCIGTGTFLVADARLRYEHGAHGSGAPRAGNLAECTYRSFHPCNQRRPHCDH